VEKPHRHHQKGTLYHVRINLTVPGKEIVVQRDPAEHQEHGDIHAAIRDAFDAAKRQLEDYARERRREVKQHAPSPRERAFLSENPDGKGAN
jgi:ribosome-associated translation inhibitor RaiA